jgi:hypothetical protein
MLWTLAMVWLALWALGFAFGGDMVESTIHVLLIAAVIAVIVQLVKERRT